MLFWVVAGIVTVVSLLIVFAPILRGAGAGERRASYDVQIYRDQLREVDQDVRRGVITPDEAADTRLEISRRLLAAAEAEAAEAASRGGPRTVSRVAGALFVAGSIGLTGWLYLGIGAPGYPDLPLAERQARQAEARASRPGQAEAEAIVADRAAEAAAAPAAPREDVALVEQLQALLAERPGDLEGHRLLARSLGAIGRFAEARRAQERVVAILGDAAEAADHVNLAELMILAANGYVSPEAEAALARALARDPLNAPGRYYSGLTLIQGGRPDLAYRLWSGLLEEGPPEAPWVRAIDAEIDDLAAMVGLPPRDGVSAGPGPDAVPGADEMTEAERQVMIEGMVAALGARLAAEGGPPEDWAQLIRSLGVLGRTGEAAAIWAEAREVFAADAPALALVAEAARGTGIAE